jgi:predicted kinase
VLLITGLPGSGKSTLASILARRYGVLVLSKDLIKEPLLDVLGAADAAHSRLLSNASFAVLFAVARRALATSPDLILEGNFRPGEHEAVLATVGPAHIIQVLCRIAEPARLARLARRREEPGRRAGHGDTDPAVVAQKSGDDFLALAGERLIFDGGESTDARELEAIDRCWRSA